MANMVGISVCTRHVIRTTTNARDVFRLRNHACLEVINKLFALYCMSRSLGYNFACLAVNIVRVIELFFDSVIVNHYTQEKQSNICKTRNIDFARSKREFQEIDYDRL